VALNQLTFQLMLTTGPALGGLVAAAAGPRACHLIDAVSFAAALYGVASLPAMPPQDGAQKPGLRAVAAGARFICRSRVLAGAFQADLDATVLGMPVALFPAINAERFAGRPQTLGLFLTAVGVGGLAGSALSGPVGHIRRPGRAMLVTVSVWGAAITGFAVVSGLWPTLGLLAIAGAADTSTVALRGTIVQTAVPEQLRGRITAADYVVGAGGGQLGNLDAGAVGSLTSPVISAASGGLASIAGAVAIGLALPAFARYRASPRTGADPADDAAEAPAQA
jgi:predicted MFS family arabinose efflux permease